MLPIVVYRLLLLVIALAGRCAGGVKGSMAGQWSGRAAKTDEASSSLHVITIEKCSKPSHAGNSAPSAPWMSPEFSVPEKHSRGPAPPAKNNWSSSRNSKGCLPLGGCDYTPHRPARLPPAEVTTTRTTQFTVMGGENRDMEVINMYREMDRNRVKGSVCMALVALLLITGFILAQLLKQHRL
ncbi:hypothetical protein PCASD_16756 [Puccinia coronata f. sp. avenae]|uniref:Uncharacterized protein n=1 Tax=Puccinia coronata f. sp. avenae TaxID=200324 RepID=A0A2N5TDZ2_9BASI|nr:hypothetical protein PCASD_16756 [Puccinia coronata f. sp. avenae]